MRYSPAPCENLQAMSLPPLSPHTAEQIAAHRDLIKECRGRACFMELARAFGTSSPSRLEVLVDGYSPRVDEDNRKIWTGKYQKWLNGALPSDETIARAESRTKEPCNLRYWRDLPLWALLAEPSPLGAGDLHQILVGCAAPVRTVVFFVSRPNSMGRYVRHDLSRQMLLQLRDMGTLDAFIACLVLAREGELMHHDQRHSLSALCAFDMFAPVLRSEPNLKQQWEALYKCLAFAFWSRAYLDGIELDFQKNKVRDYLLALEYDPAAHYKFGTGRHVPITDGERREGIDDMLLGIRNWTPGLNRG